MTTLTPQTIFPHVTKLDCRLSVNHAGNLDHPPSLDWDCSCVEGSSLVYAFRVDNLVKSFVDKDYSSIAEVEEDLMLMSNSMSTIATCWMIVHLTKAGIVGKTQHPIRDWHPIKDWHSNPKSVVRIGGFTSTSSPLTEELDRDQSFPQSCFSLL